MPSVPRSPQGAVERAATGAGHPRTGQENNGTKITENRLYKRYCRQGSTYPESVDLTYKEEIAGSIGHRPLKKYLQTAVFADIVRTIIHDPAAGPIGAAAQSLLVAKR